MPLEADRSICQKPEMPIYLAIAGDIEGQIASGRLGHNERLPSTPELAKAYGVTPRTLQQALTRLVERGLLRRAPKTGTFVDATKFKRRVAVVCSGRFFDEDTRYYGILHRALESEMLHRGLAWDFHHGLSGESFASSFSRLQAGLEADRYSCVLALTYSPSFCRWLEQECPVPSYNTAFYDIASSVREGALRLLSRGYHRVGFVAMTGDGAINTAELDGVRSAGAGPDELVQLDFGKGIDGAYRKTKEYLRSTPRELWPDAFLINHDISTKGFLIAATELGLKIPDDFALVTHANKGETFQYPVAFDTMLVDPADMAKATLDFIDATLLSDMPNLRVPGMLVKAAFILGDSVPQLENIKVMA